MTTTEGIEALFLTTHNWGRAARFWQSLGYELELDTGHGSGQLRNGAGPYVFIAEVPEDQEPDLRVVLAVPDAETLELDPGVDVVSSWAATHWGTREMAIRDPDGRVWNLQAPGGTNDGDGAS